MAHEIQPQAPFYRILDLLAGWLEVQGEAYYETLIDTYQHAGVFVDENVDVSLPVMMKYFLDHIAPHCQSGKDVDSLLEGWGNFVTVHHHPTQDIVKSHHINLLRQEWRASTSSVDEFLSEKILLLILKQ